MAASLKQDYAKILKAGAELVMISPDSREQHRQYAVAQFGEELPYLFVSGSSFDIARRYGLLREKEHHHGGFYYRSLWVLNRDATITQERSLGRQRRHCRVPETIHADRERTGRMARCLRFERAAEITPKLELRRRKSIFLSARHQA
jgi:peroxiredoxin